MKIRESIQKVKEIPEQLKFIGQMAAMALIIAIGALFIGVIGVFS